MKEKDMCEANKTEQEAPLPTPTQNESQENSTSEPSDL